MQRLAFRDIYKNHGLITEMGRDQVGPLDTDTGTCIPAQKPQVQHKIPQKFISISSGSPHTFWESSLTGASFFSFFLLLPFRCGLVNVSKRSELWRLKERFIVCSEGSWLPWRDLWKISWHFNKNNDREIIPTTSNYYQLQAEFKAMKVFNFLWLYRIMIIQIIILPVLSVPVNPSFRPVGHFLFSLLSLHFPVTGFEFKCYFQDRIQASSYRKHSLFPLVSSCSKTIRRDLTLRV